jgi:hypothetical protein
LAQSFKICPICKALNHTNAVICTTCGTSLSDVAAVNKLPVSASQGAYDFKYGENDLMESSAASGAQRGLVVAGTALVILLGAALGLAVAARPVDAPSAVVDFTEMPPPTLDFATVTLGPPTATATPTPTVTYTPGPTATPSPCVQTIVAGGSLIAAILNCGYTNLDIMPTVMALNNITNPALLQLGQQIIIPYPTPTLDPNVPTPLPAESQGEIGALVALSVGNSLLEVDTSIDAFAPTPTPTLPPGVMWHRVSAGENIITIAVAYNADAKTLSELNPEIDFARCEFGERFGGPQCLVQLRAGQLMRVPAPTPTPTLSPTPDPNATATPTPTATFNQPNVVSPPDRQFFRRDELITLRWSPTATLKPGHVYLVSVIDRTAGIAYQATTTDIAFLVPPDWQGKQAQRHEYEWSVGILDAASGAVSMQTTPRIFVWQGTLEGKP